MKSSITYTSSLSCLFLLFLLSVSTLPALSHARSLTDEVEAAVRAEVEEQHRQEQKAFIEGDCDKVATFYSDEATRYLGGRQVSLLEGLEFCRQLPRPFGQRYGSPKINDAFHVLAEDAVYFVRTIDFQPSDDDPSSFKREVVTKVWRKANDEWKIVHFHSSVHSVQVQAQNAEVPRTRTLPGIESPAFPYAQPQEVGLSSEKLGRLGDEVVEWVSNGDLVGGELLIIKDGKSVFHEAYGWSDRERKIPVERDSIWSIKSMSKPFTATAILMLADAGKLSLDDPVKQYISGFAGEERTTIRHLLSHTSGFSNDDLGDPTDAHDSLAEWVEDWASRKPTGTFGEYEYTDFGFAASGYIVEKVTGLSIGTFTEEQIAGPLGLEDTSTFFADDPAWRARLNPWYRWNDEAGGYELRWSTDAQLWSFYPAAWGMFSTAMDYAEFMAMWMNGGKRDGVQLLSEERVNEALKPLALVNDYGVYGYGWFVFGRPGNEGMPSVFYHGGGDGTLAMAYPHENAMVIFLTHSRYGPQLSALRNRLDTLGIFNHPGPDLVRSEELDVKEVELAPEHRARYVGSYMVTERGTLLPEAPRVWQEDNRLRIQLGRAGTKADLYFHLVPLGDHEFGLGRYMEGRLAAMNPIHVVRFIVNDGVVDALELQAGNRIRFTARRTDPDKVQARVYAARDSTSIAEIVADTLETEGVEAARERHRALHADRPDSVLFGKSLLYTLGYRYWTSGRMDDAIAVFEMNVEAYPDELRAHNSLGNAYREAGRLEDAKRSYERGVELAEQQEHENLPAYREKLERITQKLDGRQ